MPRYDARGIGKRIKAHRVLCDMSQRQLMDAVRPTAKLTQMHLTGLEQGVLKRLDMEVMIAIAKALDITVDYLLWGEKDVNNDEDGELCPAAPALVGP